MPHGDGAGGVSDPPQSRLGGSIRPRKGAWGGFRMTATYSDPRAVVLSGCAEGAAVWGFSAAPGYSLGNIAATLAPLSDARSHERLSSELLKLDGGRMETLHGAARRFLEGVPPCSK